MQNETFRETNRNVVIAKHIDVTFINIVVL